MFLCFGIILFVVACTNTENTKDNEELNPTEEVVLNFFHRETNKHLFEQIIKRYENENPTIKINQQHIINADYDDKMSILLASNEPIDVFDSGNIARYAYFIDKDYVYPIDDLLIEDQVNVVPYGPIFDEITINDQIYGLPFITSTWVLFYNKDIFDALGVEYPSNNMTWSEFRKLAAQVTVEAGQETIYGAYFHTWPQCWYGPALQTGASFIDIDLRPFEEALQLRVDLEQDGSVMPFSYSKDNDKYYRDVFIDGQAAMVPMGEWMIAQLRTAEKDNSINYDWDIVPMPHPDDGEPNTTWGMTAQLVINKNTEHLQQAWDFVKFTSGEGGAYIFARNGRLPAYQTDDIKKIFIGQGDKPQNIEIVLDQKVYSEMPAVPNITFIFDEIIDVESEKALRGQCTVEESIQNIEERIKSSFSEDN